MPPVNRTEQLLIRSHEIGFDPVGVCRAEPATTFPAFVSWLEETLCDGVCCGMAWLERHREARRHPAAVLSGVKSLVVVGLGYTTVHPGATQIVENPPAGFGLVAEYARGLDYHDVMRAKLRLLAETHHALFPDAKTRIAVDTAPLLEREYANRAGLGQPGKNTMLINQRHGSRFFLGVLLSTAELQEAVYNKAEHDSICGSCRRCIDACPTGALALSYRLDARKCINYWSIEHQGNDISREIATRFGNCLFGCDACQSVCPFNKPAVSHDVSPNDLALLNLREQLESGMMALSQIESLDESEFQRQFAGTPFMRLGLARLKRNTAIVRENEILQ